MKEFKIDQVFEAILIITHDLLVISPSYFVFEMESIRCITIANNLENFIKARRSLIIKSIIIVSILVSFSTAAAFLDAFTEEYIEKDDP
jgi:hypothetical protein